MPLTGHDCTVPALLIHTRAPLDVLHDAAAYRIRAVTQLLENLAFREQLSSDAVALQDFAQLLAIPLRDGCNLLDVIIRRLNSAD
ncbi:hypothetical protein AOA59_01250 [Pseudomonas sp. 2822-15]|uniref:hypothetical protein n=1 Tax=Pseudomonas sp. 2822-15 TaxID=1712677 RepID=UPI000C14A666|nr:hypothetical protein [Pseudomonas sp. 2822-15]PIB47133.1 hypothetical protein AOA59_01250 [Pseudomonas sp. 2822-15]